VGNATHRHRTRADRRPIVQKNDFVTGRLFALEAIAAFMDEGDPGGVQRAFDLLRSAGARDLRSDDDPISLCNEPIVFS
jgi:hypothetical protein